jgi:hypothetical protein
MTISNSKKVTIATALVGVIGFLPVVAFAETTSVPGPTATPAVTAPSPDGNCKAQAGITEWKTATVSQIIAAGNCSISLRNTALLAAETRVNQMKKVSSSTQASLVATLQSTISTLAAIKGTLNADTSTSTARAEYMSVGTNVRVFALVLPRTWVYATADREDTLAGNLQKVDDILVAKNATSSAAIQSQNSTFLADLATQIATIKSSVTTAQNAVSSLSPDHGDKTVAASNAAALKSARSTLEAGKMAVKAATNDIRQIRQNLHL